MYSATKGCVERTLRGHPPPTVTLSASCVQATLADQDMSTSHAHLTVCRRLVKGLPGLLPTDAVCSPDVGSFGYLRALLITGQGVVIFPWCCCCSPLAPLPIQPSDASGDGGIVQAVEG